MNLTNIQQFFKKHLVYLVFFLTIQTTWSQVDATVTGGACAGSFTLNGNGTVNGRNKYSGTVAITIPPLGTQNIPVDMQWSGGQWEIVATAPIGVVFSNTYNTTPDPPCHNLGTWVAGTACVNGHFTASSGNCSAIPVTLREFKVEILRGAKSSAQLTWRTENESDNAGFEIEKSIDGQRFTRLGWVKGGSLMGANYEFVDTHFSNKAYYRLRQKSFDGSETVSKVIALSADFKSQTSVTIFPNPSAIGLFQIESTTDLLKNSEILNAQGQIILKNDPLSNLNQIDLSNQASGVYFLRLADGVLVRLVKL